MNVGQLRAQLDDLATEDDLEVAMRIGGRLFSLTEIQVVEVNEAPFILALDGEVREEEEQEDEDAGPEAGDEETDSGGD